MKQQAQQIPDSSFAGRTFSVVEAIPKDRNAPYDKMWYWIDEKTFQTRRIESFAHNYKVKDIYILQNIQGTEYFIPQIMLVINKNKHRTVWRIMEQEINPQIEERIFSLPGRTDVKATLNVAYELPLLQAGEREHRFYANPELQLRWNWETHRARNIQLGLSLGLEWFARLKSEQLQRGDYSDQLYLKLHLLW